MRVDCDQDALLARVNVGGDGGACHTGRRSCFYRRVEPAPDGRWLAFAQELSRNAGSPEDLFKLIVKWAFENLLR